MKNLLGMAGLDPGEVREELGRLLNLLSNLGLSDYEARAYVALIALGGGNAHDVASLSKVPRTSIYKVMRGLEARDLVSQSDGKPKTFIVKSLDEVEGQIISDVREGFSILKRLEGILSEGGTPQLVYTIAGRERIVEKIGEMIDGSRSTLFLSSPEMKLLRLEHGDRFKAAADRGVEVTLVMDPFIKAPECSQAVRKEGLMVTDLVVDGETTLIATPGLEICGFIDNPFITKHLLSIMSSNLE